MTNTSKARPILNGRYELHRRIAKGGMADVFLARDQLLDRPVAVKVLFAQYAAEPSFVARFRREAQAAGKLNHPNIVAVYDWGEHEDTYFIVMEYVEGRTLAELINAEGHINPVRSAEIAKDVAGALSFAHRNGTVHRDVKPGNIMITKEGQVKVADFGIARAFGIAEDELTQTGSVMGTASYFSPEQAQGKNVDPRSDLYALGVVLFEMLCGQPPFLGDSPVAIAYKHVQELPPDAREKNANVPEPMAAVVDQLLQKDPRSRYPAAQEVKTDLQNFIEGKQLVGLRNHSAANLNISNSPETRVMPESVTSAATTVMPQAGSTQSMSTINDTGSTRAIIDTSRAVPATAAINQQEALEEYYEPPRKSGVFIAMLAILGIILVGLIVFILQTVSGDSGASSDEAEIPDVIGLTQEKATEQLKAAGFENVETRFDKNEAEESTVFEVDPQAGVTHPKDQPITIYISQKGEPIKIDDYAGRTDEFTFADLEEKGLNPTRLDRPDARAAGIVIETDPKAGSDFDPQSGLTITVVVSSGPEGAAVPNVVGMTTEAARTALGEAGFTTVNVGAPEPSSEPVGEIVRTEPDVGESAKFDDEITIFPSSGVSTVKMPNLSSLTQQQAIEILQEKGLIPTIVQVNTTDPDKVGVVLSQSPAFNTDVNVIDPVQIGVGNLQQATTTTSTTTVPPPAP